MLYLVAEDEYYYSSSGKDDIRNNYNIDELVICPDIDKILKTINELNTANICFMSPYFPEQLSKMFSANAFFDVVYLKNRYGLLTSGQKKLGITEQQALEKKLGIKIYEPKFSLKNYGGASILHSELMLAEQKILMGIPVNGFFLTGIPGTGKSFFAKCAAGETRRKLMELNLSIFMEKPNGLELLSDFFSFFKNNEGRYIIWIDEIEKMLVDDNKSQQMLGVLLTRINEVNSDDTLSSVYLIATANNISKLASSNPEFFRNGRFDLLVFINPPTEENAKEIFKIHYNIHVNTFKEKTLFYIIKNINNTASSSIKNTRLGDISKKILDVFGEKRVGYLQQLSDEQLQKEIRSNEIEIEQLNKIAEEYKFTFDIEKFMNSAISLYAESTVKSEKFPYTPAEIEYIIKDAFAMYYFSEGDIDIRRLVNKYLPLQISMKDGISKMSGSGSKFIQI